MDAGIGPYVEASFQHKISPTLLVTDAVTYVPKQPLKKISKEALLAATKNGLAVTLLSKGKNFPNVAIVDNKETWKNGKLDDPKSKQEENQKQLLITYFSFLLFFHTVVLQSCFLCVSHVLF